MSAAVINLRGQCRVRAMGAMGEEPFSTADLSLTISSCLPGIGRRDLLLPRRPETGPPGYSAPQNWALGSDRSHYHAARCPSQRAALGPGRAALS